METEKDSEGEEKEDDDDVGSTADFGDERSEGRTSVGRKSPKTLTKAEKEEHERTHCPYRNQCTHCVKSRARTAPHRKCAGGKEMEEMKVHRIHLDYSFYVQGGRKTTGKPFIGDRR